MAEREICKNGSCEARTVHTLPQAGSIVVPRCALRIKV